MGRGRAKAKQTKVARRLKYSGPATNLQALEAELKGDEDTDDADNEADEPDDQDEYVDQDLYDDTYAPYDEDDDEDRR